MVRHDDREDVYPHGGGGVTTVRDGPETVGGDSQGVR